MERSVGRLQRTRSPRMRQLAPTLSRKNFMRRLNTYFSKGNQMHLLAGAKVTSLVEFQGHLFVYHSDSSREWKEVTRQGLRALKPSGEYGPKDFATRFARRGDIEAWSDSDDLDYQERHDDIETLADTRDWEAALPTGGSQKAHLTNLSTLEPQRRGTMNAGPERSAHGLPKLGDELFMAFPQPSHPWFDGPPQQSAHTTGQLDSIGLPTTSHLAMLYQQSLSRHSNPTSTFSSQPASQPTLRPLQVAHNG